MDAYNSQLDSSTKHKKYGNTLYKDCKARTLVQKHLFATWCCPGGYGKARCHEGPQFIVATDIT